MLSKLRMSVPALFVACATLACSGIASAQTSSSTSSYLSTSVSTPVVDYTSVVTNLQTAVQGLLSGPGVGLMVIGIAIAIFRLFWNSTKKTVR